MSDMIDRQAAIDALDCINGTEEVLRSLPSVQPEQRWIPTSKRPPKVREWVLCQCRAGIMDVLRLTQDGTWDKNYPHVEYMSGFVIAWMPLPAAYREEEGNE